MKLKALYMLIIALTIIFPISAAAFASAQAISTQQDGISETTPENTSQFIRFSNQEIINGNTTVIDALRELGLSAENISALQSELQLSFNSNSAVDIVATTNGMFTVQGTSLKPLNCWPGNGAAAVMSSSGPGTMISKFSLSAGSPNPVLAMDYCPDMFGCTYYHDVQPGAPYIIVYSHQAEHPSLINHSAWCL